MRQRTLDSSNLSYVRGRGGRDATLTLLADDPVRRTRCSAIGGLRRADGPDPDLLRRAAWASRRSTARRRSIAGTIVNETVDDQLTRLGLTMGLRQPLGTERLRLIASARRICWTTR